MVALILLGLAVVGVFVPARSQRRYSQRSTICSRTARNSLISVLIISIAAQKTSGPNALSSSSQSLASTPGSRPLPQAA